MQEKGRFSTYTSYEEEYGIDSEIRDWGVLPVFAAILLFCILHWSPFNIKSAFEHDN